MIFKFILVLIIGAAARLPSLAAYDTKYRSVVTPLGLYLKQPSVVAPISPPWPRRHQAITMRSYLDLLFDHEAYIQPDADNRLAALRKRTITTLTHETEPRARDYQKGLVIVLEEAANQARHEIQVALHPTNVRAQHRQAVDKLTHEIRDILDVLKTGANTELVTNRLETDEKVRFTNAHNILTAEYRLLKSAAKFATKTPLL